MEQEKKVLYRVRSSWEDADSQKGVFGILENAIKNCDHAGEGYHVFDDEGNIVYPEVADDDIEVEIFEEEPEDEVEVREWHTDDIASLRPGAVTTTGKAFPDWFFRTRIYVRSVKASGRIDIALTKRGQSVGLVDPEMLMEFDPSTERLPDISEMVICKEGPIEVGDKVQVHRDAHYTNDKVVPKEILDMPMYVMDIHEDDGIAIIGREPAGRINGIVKMEDISPFREVKNSKGKVKIVIKTALHLNPGPMFKIIGIAQRNQVFEIVDIQGQWGLAPGAGWIYLPHTKKV